MWVQKCFSLAQGYAFAAFRNGTECWYGNALDQGSSSIYSLSNCMVPCTGDSLIGCGGKGGEFLVYQQTPATWARILTSVTAGSKTFGNPACYFHPQGTPALQSVSASASMTVEMCVALAAAEGATYAGIENGNQCWYGDLLANTLTYEPTTNNCRFTNCAGNSLEYCGSVSRILMYQLV